MSRPPSRSDRARRRRESNGGVAVHPSKSHVSQANEADLVQWKTLGYAVALMFAVALLGCVLVWLQPLAIVDAFTHARLAYEGFHNESATIRGQRIHYYEGGSGKPILLVHGLGSRAEDWANLMPQLKNAGFHVYAVDLLGYGLSAQPRDASYSIAEEATYVEDFLADRKLEKVSLAGWSMGGWVAMRVALDQPQRIDRLVLCDAAGLRFTPSVQVQDFEPTTVESVRRLYRLLMPRPSDIPGFLARAMVRKAQKINWVVDRSARSMFAGQDLMDGKLGPLTMPTLIVWGRQDHLVPLEVGILLHQQIRQSSLAIFDGCGHLAPGQCAPRIGPPLVAFLQGRGPEPEKTVEFSAQ